MTTEHLVSATSFMFGVDRADLFGSNRTARVAEARQVLAWALRRANWSLESIGDFLHRDHTTIIYAVKVIERKAARSARFAERLAALTQPAEAPVDWQARVLALEARVTELETLLRGHVAESETT
jgi:chromosomal replication initiation ATPase DnaA